MTARRDLRFDTLDAAVRDAEHLLAAGYVKVGNWSLAQCCGHLTNWLTYQMDGFPPTPLVLRPVVWLMRNTMAGPMRRKMTAGDQMPAGMTTIPASVPPADADDAAAVADFRAAVVRWLAFAGELKPSPLLGSMAKDEWLRVHKIHAAHHLSFLVPKA